MEAALAWVSPWEIAIVVGVLLLLFGAHKIPALMRSLGSGMTEFKRGIKEGERGDDSAGEPVEVGRR